MADNSNTGTITIDRLARGFKVTAWLHRPGSDRPEPLAEPDHFPAYAHALRFAQHLQGNTGWTLRDNCTPGASDA